MHAKKLLQRARLLAGALVAAGSLAALAGAPAAFATTDIYASGAAIQKSVQSLWITDDSASVTYTSTNSASGFNEFGNFTGSLNTAEDTGAPSGQLDGYVAVDNAPTGPASTVGTNLYEAAQASGGPSEVTIPVGQTPLALLISLPNDVSLPSNTQIKLPNLWAAAAYAGTVPAAGVYAANTWGALLELLGLTAITSGTPTSGEFLDTGSSSGKTGGYSAIEDEVRTNGAGATLALKQYFDDVDSTDWGSTTIDENTSGTSEWPSGATIAGSNSSDSNESQETALTPGTLGYATLASATTSADGGFTNGALTGAESGAGTNQILYALLQDNGTATSGEKYADPESGTGTEPNVYTGADINVNGSGGVGNWIVPSTYTGDWATSTTNAADYTHSWDPNVYTNAGSSSKWYPLVITLWILSWDPYQSGNLTSTLFPNLAVSDILSFLSYITAPITGTSTAATSGQYAEQNDSSYYAALPTGGEGLANIQKDANDVALLVNP